MDFVGRNGALWSRAAADGSAAPTRLHHAGDRPRPGRRPAAASTATACWPRPAGAAARSWSGSPRPAASPRSCSAAPARSRRRGRRRADRRHRGRRAQRRRAVRRRPGRAADRLRRRADRRRPAAADAGADRDRAGRLPGARLAGARPTGRRPAPGAAGDARRPARRSTAGALFDEAQVYAGAGYAVVLGNPRGSAGYGQDHGRAIRRRWATVDADDLLALLDAALADRRHRRAPGSASWAARTAGS